MMRKNTAFFRPVAKIRILLVFCSLIVSSVEKYEVYVIETLSKYIGDMVLECQKELEFTDEVIQDLMDFWNEKNDLRSPDLGCALVCVFEKNEFLNEEGSQVVPANVNAFYRACGADERMSRKMLELFQMCKKSTRTISNLCANALEIAKCFRYGMFGQHWAPAPGYWRNQTELPPDSEPEQVSSDDQSSDPAIIKEMNLRKIFSELFRRCQN